MTPTNRLLIDTDILIDVAHGNPIAISRLSAEQKVHKSAISVITKTELIVGCRSKKDLKELNEFL